MRPATNEEAKGIEIVISLLPNLTEAVREGRTVYFADITEEGDPEDDVPIVVEGDVMDVPWEDQIRSRNRSSMHLQIPTLHHTVTDQKPTRSPRPKSRLQSVIAEYDFERERETPRDNIWTYPRIES